MAVGKMKMILMEVRRLPDLSRRVWQSELAGCDFPHEGDAAAWSAFEALSVELAAKHLTPEALDSLARLPENRGIVVIENLPVDTPLVAPPTDSFRPSGKPAISEAVHLGIIRQLAHVFGFQEEEGGAIFHQIAPKAGREHSQSNGGVVLFRPHSDDAFLFRHHRPEFLSLYGLLNERAAPTWLFPVEGILDLLAPQVIDRLQESRFRHAAPQSFHIGDPDFDGTLHPVIEAHASGWEITFNSARTSAVDAAAEAALTAFQEALQHAPHREVVIAPGTLVIFSNVRHLHGRGAISGRRWLQRLYSRRDLSALRADSGVEAPGLVFPAARLVAGYALTV
jgi:L-asparagine oxygenase